jgi:hypothetical protein
MNVAAWIKHFERNREDRPEPDWSAPVQLKEKLGPEGFAKLVRSLQQFQLGDGGGPASLIAVDRERFFEGESRLKPLVQLWFKEEEEHSRLLGDTLKRFGAPSIQDHWSFSLFCGMRKYLGVRFELSALLLTEIVSHVYYKMLRRYADDVALRRVCSLIIRDEAGHIAFHRARLAGGARHRGGSYGPVWELGFRLRGMGAGDTEFYRGIWRAMGRFVAGVRADVAWEQKRARARVRSAPTLRRL